MAMTSTAPNCTKYEVMIVVNRDLWHRKSSKSGATEALLHGMIYMVINKEVIKSALLNALTCIRYVIMRYCQTCGMYKYLLIFMLLMYA